MTELELQSFPIYLDNLTIPIRVNMLKGYFQNNGHLPSYCDALAVGYVLNTLLKEWKNIPTLYEPLRRIGSLTYTVAECIGHPASMQPHCDLALGLIEEIEQFLRA